MVQWTILAIPLSFLLATRSIAAELACDVRVPRIDIPAGSKSLDEEAAASKLFKQDQRDRKNPNFETDWNTIAKRDLIHRKLVIAKLKRSEIRSAKEFYVAAMIFQHGTCPEQYLFANVLARTAMDRGSVPAKWLYAATLDRYLLSIGKTQKYGTQYRVVNGKSVLLPFDQGTTDAERAKYNVPPSTDAQ